MMVDIARYQVDIVAGDANTASYTLKKKQAEPSFYDSSFNTMMRGLESFMQHSQPGWPQTMGYRIVSSNAQENLEALDSHFAKPDRDWNLQPNIDCVVACILSWGHGYSAQVFRQLNETDALNTVSTKSLTMNDEWSIVVSEYAMYLENRHLWLGEKDADWHVPLNIIIKPADVGNQRKRTEQKRWERWQRYLTATGKGKDKGKAVHADKGKGYQHYSPEPNLPPWREHEEPPWRRREYGTPPWRTTATGSSSSRAAEPEQDSFTWIKDRSGNWVEIQNCYIADRYREGAVQPDQQTASESEDWRTSRSWSGWTERW
jgi:hypothetical protein